MFRMAALLAGRDSAHAPLVVLAFGPLPGHGAHSVPARDAESDAGAPRALGIGSTLTTLHPQVMKRVYALFGVPEQVEFHGCIPLGYPRGRFGPTRRLESRETTYFALEQRPEARRVDLRPVEVRLRHPLPVWSRPSGHADIGLNRG